MRIYLAGGYSRREELNRYARELEQMTHLVVARWLHGQHEMLPGMPEEVRGRFAEEDLEDLLQADCVIVFTDEQAPSRGGHHVETGLAIAMHRYGRRLLVVGPRTNVFHWLPRVVEHYESWPEARLALRAEVGV